MSTPRASRLVTTLLLLALGCRREGLKASSIAGTVWRLQRFVRLSPALSPNTVRTQHMIGDSILEIRLVADSHATPRLAATLVMLQSGTHRASSFEAGGTESPDGLISLAFPGAPPLWSEAVTVTGGVANGALVLLGDRSERESYLDSLIFRRMSNDSSQTGFVLVERGDSALTAGRAALVQRMRGFLRNLTVSEEAHFADRTAYTPKLADLPGIDVPPGVTVALGLTADGWYGTARHDSGVTCHVYMGTFPPAMKGHRQGDPWCE